MTDRFNILTVVLDHDIRNDDAEPILTAIKQLRGVLTVAGNVADPIAFMAEERARMMLIEKLVTIIEPKARA